MDELKSTKSLVLEILENNPQCRNSDSFLYFAVLKAIGSRRGLDVDTMSIPYFLLNLHGTTFPCYETVRRTRQKVQAENPHLRACETVDGYRAENETVFRAFARVCSNG